MPSNDSRDNIQEMQQGEKDFGMKSSLQNMRKKIVNNGIIAEIDLFSIPMKLNMNGNQIYQTVFGGLMHLIFIIICLGLTYIVIYPDGVELTSEITETKIAKDYGDTGQTLFDHSPYPIGFNGLKRNGTKYDYCNLTGLATFYVYQVNSDNTRTNLQVSNDCGGNYEFCIKNTQLNKNVKIYGRPSINGTFYTYLVYQIIWCDPSLGVFICPSALNFNLEAAYSNFYKEKGGKLSEYTVKNSLPINNLRYQYNVTRQVYTSNSKLFGHISNIFSFDMETYRFTSFPKKSALTAANLLTPGNYTTRKFIQVRNIPIGETSLIKQNFDDIGDTILFFLSVKQTFYFVIFVLFIRQYNKNSGYLEIGDSLYYIDDPKTKRKYNFKKGPQVFLACMLHNHFLSGIINFILFKFGKTLHDYLPNKSICAISQINRAEQLLQQNTFYGTLNDLSKMQSQAHKKIPLAIRNEREQEQQEQASYFPFEPTEDEPRKKQKQIKRQAFQQFCQANQFISAKRKNLIYKILTNNKLKYILAHQMQTEFKSFVRNVKIQMNEDIYRELSQEQASEIKVAVHDSSRNQMTAHNFMRN